MINSDIIEELFRELNEDSICFKCNYLDEMNICMSPNGCDKNSEEDNVNKGNNRL